MRPRTSELGGFTDHTLLPIDGTMDQPSSTELNPPAQPTAPIDDGISQRGRQAAGQPIRKLMSLALDNPSLISLAAGFVDKGSLPQVPTQQALSTFMDDPDASRTALQYGTTFGHTELREILLAEAREDGATNVSIDQLLITAGSNQLLHILAESILDPGDIVLCAAPTYFVFLGTLAGVGAEAWGVETDAQGMIPESLMDTWQELNKRDLARRVKAIYIVPYFDNPRGVSMPAERRQKVVELADRWSSDVGHRISVISDEAYRGLQYEGDSVPSTLVHDEDGSSVVVAGTFSKVFSPGIRVGWGIIPKHLVTPMCDLKGNIDFGSPNFSQHLMAEVLSQGLLAPHVESLKQTYREKRAAMLAAAEEFLGPLAEVEWDRPHGGLYVWLRLPEMVDAGPDGSLLQRAQDLGVLYVPGQYCFAANGAKVQRNTMRLSFGVQSCENIREGIRLLAEAIRSVA